ncbi:exodeoxyribonuclease III [Cupriavidus gilardii]|nr:exodeoxyribonuclease III [Cupriavidus gilardii]
MAMLKIATFNINGIRARLPALLEWLEREAPDVVCLQELKTADAGFPIDAIRAAGYGAIWHGEKSWNGVAILSRGTEPIESRRGLPGDDGDKQSRYIEAAVHGVLVGCLYLPNGNPQPGPKFEYKLAWFERLLKYAATLYDSGHPVVLAGDYNVVPTDDDIYNPRSWLKDALLQPESRACYRRLLEQGWVDALRARYPDERIYTFWDYFRQHWQTNSGLRIDHLLLNATLAPALREAGVDRWVRGMEQASDHAPAWVTLEFGGGGARRRASSTAAGKTVAKAPAKKSTARKAAAVAKAVIARTATDGGKATAAKKAPVAKKATAAKKTAAKKTAAKKTAAKKTAAARPGATKRQ